MKFNPETIGVFGNPINVVKESYPFFRVEEQPGDGTRYTHIFIVDGLSFRVMGRDREVSGATLINNNRIYFRELDELEPMLAKTDVREDMEIVRKFMSEKAIKVDGENSFTVASVARCLIHILNEHVRIQEACV